MALPFVASQRQEASGEGDGGVITTVSVLGVAKVLCALAVCSPRSHWIHTDLNCLSAIQYAVDVLEVRHIMVVGHHGCGGVMAALEPRRVGLAHHWIHRVENVRHVHARRKAALAELWRRPPPPTAADRGLMHR